MVDTQFKKKNIYINDDLSLYIRNITVNVPSNRMISLILDCSAISKLLRHFSVSPKLRKIQKYKEKKSVRG